ncbi:hypothetical protein FJT64_000362 [Amphibalanus amphitrite]|uniref:Uncharacterized protein n=1 Tax=Amphibalanus amphitrite TaxID=1232801 RepID=A0A6A4WAQ5_AMPAM|nr:hypothetical protein FJT64_000362 [Amphibalanus amphitrite]
MTVGLLDGIICLDSRVKRSPELSPTARNPPVLARDHKYTELLIEHLHQKMGHRAHDAVLMLLVSAAVTYAAPSDLFRPPERPLGQDFDPFTTAVLQQVDLFVRNHFPLHPAQPYVDRPEYIGKHGFRAETLLERLS